MSEKYKLEMERVLKAPQDGVWEACTDAKMLRNWWGQPKGATAPVFDADIRVGGSLHFKVELPGIVVWGKVIYKEIIPKEKIVVLDYYSDEEGNLLDTPELPASIVTLTLTPMGDETKIKIIHEGISGVHSIEDYKAGWAQTLDRLSEVLHL